MSVIVVNTNEPNYDYDVPTSTVDVDEIDQSVEYQSNYIPSQKWDVSFYSPTGSGSDGIGISDISWISNSAGSPQGTAGTIDTYEITYTDGSSFTYTVANGSNGSTGPAGTDGSDGRGIVSIIRTVGDGSAGTTDTYTITYTDGDPTTFTVTNGADGTNGNDGITYKWLTGSVNPTTEGINGDMYLNTTSGQVFKKISGAWVSQITTIIGTDGAKGDTGLTGDTGDDGTNGTDGISINWLADSATIPASPTENDAYYNTTDNKSYIYDGTAWQTVAEDGVNGDPGADGSDGYSLISIDTTSTITDSLFLSNAGRAAMNGDAILNTNSGDNILYVRETGAWVSKGTVNGTDGTNGDPGIDGTDGDQWTYGTGSPTNTAVRTYDTYYINTNDNSIYYKASGTTTWSQISTLTGALYTTTSTDTINLSAKSVGDTFTVNIADSNMSYTVGQVLIVANSNTAKFYAEVASYSDGTTISLTITHIIGSTSHASWELNLSGVPYSYDETSAGQVFEVGLDAATTVSGRIALTPVIPDGWTLTDGSSGGATQNDPDDLIINHNVTDSSGNYRPVFDAKIMYKAGSSPDVYVSFVGDAAYTKLANDTTNGKVELASLTTENYSIKIHLIFA